MTYSFTSIQNRRLCVKYFFGSQLRGETSHYLIRVIHTKGVSLDGSDKHLFLSPKLNSWLEYYWTKICQKHSTESSTEISEDLMTYTQHYRTIRNFGCVILDLIEDFDFIFLLTFCTLDFRKDNWDEKYEVPPRNCEPKK